MCPSLHEISLGISGGGGLVTKSCPTLVTLWIEEPGRLQSMGFSRQEYWSGLPFPSPGDLPNPGIKPGSLALQADSLPAELPGKSRGNISQHNKSSYQSVQGTHCAVLSRSVVSDSLKPHGLEPARLLCPWGFSRQEYCSELPCPVPGIELPCLTSPCIGR